jgi:hypothetical protein
LLAVRQGVIEPAIREMRGAELALQVIDVRREADRLLVSGDGVVETAGGECRARLVERRRGLGVRGNDSGSRLGMDHVSWRCRSRRSEDHQNHDARPSSRHCG